MRSKVPSCLVPPAYHHTPNLNTTDIHTFALGKNTLFQVMCLRCVVLCWVLSHRDKPIVLQLWHLTLDLVRPTFHGKLRSHTHRIISTLIQISTQHNIYKHSQISTPTQHNNIYTELGMYTKISTLM